MGAAIVSFMKTDRTPRLPSSARFKAIKGQEQEAALPEGEGLAMGFAVAVSLFSFLLAVGAFSQALLN